MKTITVEPPPKSGGGRGRKREREGEILSDSDADQPRSGGEDGGPRPAKKRKITKRESSGRYVISTYVN